MSALRFSLRNLRQELRAGELRILGLAVIIAVAAVSSVGFYADRIEAGMEQNAAELLAADLRLFTHGELEPQWRIEAGKRELQTSEVTSFRSVVAAGARTQLVEAKAVEAGYPLRGTLRYAAQPFGTDAPTSQIPQPGTVWVESRLLPTLGLNVGDSLELGYRSFQIAGIVTYEPDRGGDLFSIAPRLMLNRQDLEETGLIQAGSHTHHALLVAGPLAEIESFGNAIKPELPANVRLESVRDARPQVRSALDRAGRFMGLAALLSVLLAGVAIATATHRYAQRHLDSAAMLRCLGAEQGFVLRVFGLQVLILGLIAGLLGLLLGWLAQGFLGQILQGLLQIELPPPGPMPAIVGVGVGLLTLFGFSLPPLLRLKQVSPLRVLRRELGWVPPSAIAVYGLAVVTLALLALWQSGDLKLTSLVLGGTVATIALLAGGARVLVLLLTGLRGRVGVAWRYGLANIARHTGSSTIQIVAIGLGIMTLLLLAIVRTDLLSVWENSLPQTTPNQFLINIQPQQVAEVEAFFLDQGLGAVSLYPMVRGRLTHINGAPVEIDQYPSERAQRLLQREFNLTWSEHLPSHNELITGDWWPDSSIEAYSIESGIAETLGVAIGDRLTFNHGSIEVTAEVTNMRKVEWDSFKANFFVIASPALLAELPANYITSFHLPGEQRALLNQLLRKLPNITVLDVDAILTKVRTIIQRVTWAVEFIFGFTLLAGVLVLLAAVQTSLDHRCYEATLLRTLGADRRRLRQGLLSEFLLLGLLAGTLASIAAWGTGWAVATFALDLPYHTNPWLFVSGLLGGMLSVALAGMWGTRKVLRVPPWQVLRPQGVRG